MKKTTRIGGSVTGVISTGSFENFRPLFTWEETIEGCVLTDEQVQARGMELYRHCESIFEQAASAAAVKRIEKERKDLRLKFCKELNKHVPSTTSVINWDADFFVPPHQLSQYASQGNITHERVLDFIQTNVWKKAGALAQLWSDIVIVSEGDLRLPLEVGDFPALLKKHPITGMKPGSRAFNTELETTGENDFTGTPSGDWAENIESCFDVKRTPDKIKNGMQLADYCKQRGLKQGIVLPLNDKTAQGFSKPIVYDEEQLNGYYEMFKKKREEFKKRYGI